MSASLRSQSVLGEKTRGWLRRSSSAPPAREAAVLPPGMVSNWLGVPALVSFVQTDCLLIWHCHIGVPVDRDDEQHTLSRLYPLRKE